MMSDISFSGLGSFSLFLFVSVFSGLCIATLLLRQYQLFRGASRKKVRSNEVLIGAFLFPFIVAIMGLIVLSVSDQLEIKILFDNYLSITLIILAAAAGIIWLVVGFRKLEKDFS